MPRKRLIGFCTIEGCERPLKSSTGVCQYHYNKKRLIDNPDKLNRHPFYHLWFERKQCGLLCWEWTSFKYFVEGISPKPEGEFFLVRIRENEPFGPDNFKWAEHLRRKPNETNSEWWARKLEARKRANPNLESDRNIKRKYGLTREDYNKKLKEQDDVCAICGLQETAFDARTNTVRRLAVDHNHKTGKIRGLLCWRCNGTIGRINEDLELVKNIENYLIKHNGVN